MKNIFTAPFLPGTILSGIPDYDSYWINNSPLCYVTHPDVPQFHVGGFFDQEDFNGPQLMYSTWRRRMRIIESPGAWPMVPWSVVGRAWAIALV